MDRLPTFECNNEDVNKAFRYAIACVASNVITMKSGVLQEERPCIMAGNHYRTPWTRDSAINVYNAMALLSPEISKNTLLSVIYEKDGKTIIGDQYWDKIIWTIGAYKLYQVNQDKDFLRFVYETVKNTLTELEETEFDEKLSLFRGGAVYGDGVSAYPTQYRNPDLSAGILDWARKNPMKKYPKGVGIPMKALSTNCVYAEAYRIMYEMANILGEDGSGYAEKSKKIKDAINRLFWNQEKGCYDYLQGECEAQESLGLAFSLLFDVANVKRGEVVIEKTYSTEYGIPCVYPCFDPYRQYGYGRHCGTIWPHIQGFWAKAMRKYSQNKKFDLEFYALTKNAVRDKQFAEIYHPETGEIYGGVQEWNGEYVMWKSEDYQTWSATAYLNMILEGIVGIEVNEKISFHSYLPDGIDWVELKNLQIRGKRVDVEIRRGIQPYIEKQETGARYKIYVK